MARVTSTQSPLLLPSFFPHEKENPGSVLSQRSGLCLCERARLGRDYLVSGKPQTRVCWGSTFPSRNTHHKHPCHSRKALWSSWCMSMFLHVFPTDSLFVFLWLSSVLHPCPCFKCTNMSMVIHVDSSYRPNISTVTLAEKSMVNLFNCAVCRGGYSVLLSLACGLRRA